MQHRPQEYVYKSLRLWNLLVDLEESLGTMETTKAAYDRMFTLKIITPQVSYEYVCDSVECIELCGIFRGTSLL